MDPSAVVQRKKPGRPPKATSAGASLMHTEIVNEALVAVSPVHDGHANTPTPPLDASGECRRSSRKKIIKFDVREVLNKHRKQHKIQIEARIDSNAVSPKPSNSGDNASENGASNNQEKCFIEKTSIIQRSVVYDHSHGSSQVPISMKTEIFKPNQSSSLIVAQMESSGSFTSHGMYKAPKIIRIPDTGVLVPKKRGRPPKNRISIEKPMLFNEGAKCFETAKKVDRQVGDEIMAVTEIELKKTDSPIATIDLADDSTTTESDSIQFIQAKSSPIPDAAESLPKSTEQNIESFQVDMNSGVPPESSDTQLPIERSFPIVHFQNVFEAHVSQNLNKFKVETDRKTTLGSNIVLPLKKQITKLQELQAELEAAESVRVFEEVSNVESDTKNVSAVLEESETSAHTPPPQRSDRRSGRRFIEGSPKTLEETFAEIAANSSKEILSVSTQKSDDKREEIVMGLSEGGDFSSPKLPIEDTSSSSISPSESSIEQGAVVPKRRGRPPKVKIVPDRDESMKALEEHKKVDCKIETERCEQEKPETERFEQEKPATERCEQDKPETETCEQEKPETERFEQEKSETERCEQEKPEKCVNLKPFEESSPIQTLKDVEERSQSQNEKIIEKMSLPSEKSSDENNTLVVVDSVHLPSLETAETPAKVTGRSPEKHKKRSKERYEHKSPSKKSSSHHKHHKHHERSSSHRRENKSPTKRSRSKEKRMKTEKSREISKERKSNQKTGENVPHKYEDAKKNAMEFKEKCSTSGQTKSAEKSSSSVKEKHLAEKTRPTSLPAKEKSEDESMKRAQPICNENPKKDSTNSVPTDGASFGHDHPIFPKVKENPAVEDYKKFASTSKDKLTSIGNNHPELPKAKENPNVEDYKKFASTSKDKLTSDGNKKRLSIESLSKKPSSSSLSPFYKEKFAEEILKKTTSTPDERHKKSSRDESGKKIEKLLGESTTKARTFDDVLMYRSADDKKKHDKKKHKSSNLSSSKISPKSDTSSFSDSNKTSSLSSGNIPKTPSSSSKEKDIKTHKHKRKHKETPEGSTKASSQSEEKLKSSGSQEEEKSLKMELKDAKKHARKERQKKLKEDFQAALEEKPETNSTLEVKEEKVTNIPTKDPITALEVGLDIQEITLPPTPGDSDCGSEHLEVSSLPLKDEAESKQPNSDQTVAEPDPLYDIEKFIEAGVNLLKKDYKLTENEEAVGKEEGVVQSSTESATETVSGTISETAAATSTETASETKKMCTKTISVTPTQTTTETVIECPTKILVQVPTEMEIPSPSKTTTESTTEKSTEPITENTIGTTSVTVTESLSETRTETTSEITTETIFVTSTESTTESIPKITLETAATQDLGTEQTIKNEEQSDETHVKEELSSLQTTDSDNLEALNFYETPVDTPASTTAASSPSTSPTPTDNSVDTYYYSDGARRSHRLKKITSAPKALVGRGLVRDRDRERLALRDDIETKSYYSIEDHLMDLAEVEAKNAKFLKEMEERLSNFLVIKENEYHCERVVSREARKMICDCFLTPEEAERGELGCGEDCLNRLLMIECGVNCRVGERCTNNRFQKYLCAPCRVFRTEKKGFGIMADVEIHPGEFIMEYVGEVLDSDEFEKRRVTYSKDKNRHYYFMALRSDAIIDATVKGNVSRFINHSCDPNAETQKWTVNGELRIGFFSRKNIMPGEEITFDYQYQRYGREAQRCFCESENCRGWIGEEPNSDEGEQIGEGDDDDDEDDDDEDDDEEDESDVVSMVKGLMSVEDGEDDDVKDEMKAQLRKKSIKDTSSSIDDESDESKQKFMAYLSKISAKIEIHKKNAREEKKRKRRQRKQAANERRPTTANANARFLEDPDLEDEIDFLSRCGLKNQSDTLRLSRLMVRAKLSTTRLNLLAILRAGELPCRRLFLDYHGMHLLRGWMNEDGRTDMTIRMALLETLESLPIPNKTILTESKVYQTIRGWCNTEASKVEGSSPSPSDESSKESATTGNNVEKQATNENSQEIVESPKSELEKLAQKLLSSWDNLPEIFRIPKRERIEQMKEHEREADRQYAATVEADDEEVDDDDKADFSKDRYQRDRFQRRFGKPQGSRSISVLGPGAINMLVKRPNSSDVYSLEDKHLSKEERRELFAAKVARDEAEKRKAESRREFETKCTFFGLDPLTTKSDDIPFCVSEIGEWQNAKRATIKTPPAFAFAQPPVKPMSTNPADYYLPNAATKLPPEWNYAITEQGKIYYYHVKHRVPQWEPPTVEQINSTKWSDDESESDEEESEVDKELSEEQMKEIEAIQTEDELNAYLKKIIQEQRQRRYKRLVDERPISPRREEDRIYNQIEMRKYKENKEKIKKRKLTLRRRSEAANNSILGLCTLGGLDEKPSSSQAAAANSSMLENTKIDADAADLPDDAIPIQDFLLSSDEENDDIDAMKAECNNSPLLDKIVQGDKIVDELDALTTKRQLKRPLPPHRDFNFDLNISSILNNESLMSNLEKIEHKKRKQEKKDKSKRSKDSSSDAKYRKSKEKFRCEIAGIIVQHLKPYRKDSCIFGRIKSNDDFNHLARKLTHFVMVKELKYCESVGQNLVVTESVKNKSREFIRKYMAKYEAGYVKPQNDPEFKDIPYTL